MARNFLCKSIVIMMLAVCVVEISTSPSPIFVKQSNVDMSAADYPTDTHEAAFTHRRQSISDDSGSSRANGKKDEEDDDDDDKSEDGDTTIIFHKGFSHRTGALKDENSYMKLAAMDDDMDESSYSLEDLYNYDYDLSDTDFDVTNKAFKRGVNSQHDGK